MTRDKKAQILDLLGSFTSSLSRHAPDLAHRAERYALSKMVPNLVDVEAFEETFQPLDPSVVFGATSIALYVHIPYCAAICSYCVFNRSANTRTLPRYLDCLHRELERYGSLPYFRACELSSLYVGGGTPTLLDPGQLERLFETIDASFAKHRDFQASMESTPDSLDDDKLAVMVAAGLHRLSIGVQSFDDAILAGMGRAHRGDDGVAAIESARTAGIEEVSIDLIYGLEGQTPEDFVAGLRRGIEAGITHFSMFPLVAKDDSPLTRVAAERRDACYRLARDTLSAAGFRVYSTEDSTRGVECRYETDAWRVPRKRVLGVGLSALSGVGGHFFANESRLRTYMERVEGGEFPVAGGKRIPAREDAFRSLIMGLKYLEMPLDVLREIYGESLFGELRPAIDALAASGYVVERGSKLCLTERGELFCARNSAAIILGNLDHFSGATAKASGSSAKAS